MSCNICDCNLWRLCTETETMIIPVRMYTNWGDDENKDEKKFIGVKFVALPYYPVVVIEDGGYFEIDDAVVIGYNYYDTPEEALAAELGISVEEL